MMLSFFEEVKNFDLWFTNIAFCNKITYFSFRSTDKHYLFRSKTEECMEFAKVNKQKKE